MHPLNVKKHFGSSLFIVSLWLCVPQETFQGWCFSAEARAQIKRSSRQRPELCAHSAVPHHQVNSVYATSSKKEKLCLTAEWHCVFVTGVNERKELYSAYGYSVISFTNFLGCVVTELLMLVFISCSFLIAHSFGRRMLYPGSVGLLQKAMRPMLQQGQARLIEEVKNKHIHTQMSKLTAMNRKHHNQPLSLYCVAVRRPKEQAGGLWWKWDRHNVCGSEGRWGTEWPDSGELL